MIVKARGQTVRLELVNRRAELPAKLLPAFDSRGAAGSGREDEVFDAENLAEFDGLGDAVARREGLDTIVRRVTPKAEVIHLTADVLGGGNGPVVIGRIKFNHLVTDLRDRAKGVRNVARKFVSNRVEFETDGIFFLIHGRGCRVVRSGEGVVAQGLRGNDRGDRPGNREEISA